MYVSIHTQVMSSKLLRFSISTLSGKLFKDFSHFKCPRGQHNAVLRETIARELRVGRACDIQCLMKCVMWRRFKGLIFDR